MTTFFEKLTAGITNFSDFICGYPMFLLLIGGGLILFCYSKAVSIRCIGHSMKALTHSSNSGEGQISSFQALMSAIASTVGMGNIAGVAIAITVGGPGAIFWMWVSAIVGMSTKFFEGALAIMYKGRDSAGQPQGGVMYILEEGLGKSWRPLAIFFAIAGLIGTLCVMQANQLVESITTVFTTPMGIENTLGLRFAMGLVIASIVGCVVIGGIKRISVISSKIGNQRKFDYPFISDAPFSEFGENFINNFFNVAPAVFSQSIIMIKELYDPKSQDLLTPFGRKILDKMLSSVIPGTFYVNVIEEKADTTGLVTSHKCYKI